MWIQDLGWSLRVGRGNNYRFDRNFEFVNVLP